MNLFSGRELAIGVWIIIGFSYFIYSPKFRPHIKNIARSFFKIKILTPIIGLGIFVSIISYFLIEIGLWNFNQYKNAALWFILVGIYSLFQVADTNKGKRYLKGKLANLLKITTLFEFAVAFYSFSFWFELVFIPFMTFITLMSELSKNNKEHKIVSNVLDHFIMIIGFCIIIYISFLFASNPGEFFREDTAYDFLVPIFLTLGALPYLFMVMLYAEYESFFVRLNFIFKDRELKKFAKRKAMLHLNCRLSKLKRWEHYLSRHEIKSKDDINDSIKKIIFLTKRDKSDIPVKFDSGWSHFKARRYLKGFELMASYYDHLYDERWGASSESLKLGEGFFCNKIIYHVDGNKEAATCLTLVLEIEQPELFENDLKKFQEISNHLFKKSVSKDKTLSIKLEEAESNDGDICQTYITEIAQRYIMIQKLKSVYRDSFEIRLSFSIDKDSFRYSAT